jgi:hypothetical protein
MQNIPFRSEVFVNHLASFEIFEAITRTAIEERRQKIYILERNSVMAGYSHYHMAENTCEIIVWGRWLKTLMYASLKVAFDTLGVQSIHSTVRKDNKRVVSAYEYFSGRVIGRELLPFQQKGILGKISMVGVLIYQLTLEEFRAKEEMFCKQAMPVEIINSASE